MTSTGDGPIGDSTRVARLSMLVIAAAVFGAQTLAHKHLTGLEEYDDGVYFAAAVNLVHGILPYSGYGFIQPPGIVVVLAPFALAARFVGTAHGFEAARMFIACLAVLNVWLVGRLLRHRRNREVVVAMAVMAAYPGAVSSAQTLLIEPVLVALCLLALLALFQGDQLTESRRRQLLAGGFLGLAMATKIWALVPLVVIAFVLWRATRNAPTVQRLCAGAALGFAALTLPLAGRAPNEFWRGVVIDQAVRNPGGYLRPERLADLSGTTLVTHQLAASRGGTYLVDTFVAVAALALLAVVVSDRRITRPMTALDTTGIWTSVLLVGVFLASRTYYYHYSGFVAPFLALCAARAVAGTTQRSRPARVRSGAVLVAVTLAIGVVAVGDAKWLARETPTPQLSAELLAALPSHGCILYFQPALGLLANRYTATDHGCPRIVDYLAEERLLDSGRAQMPTDELAPILQRQMLKWLSATDAIVVGGMLTSWGPSVRDYVSSNFAATVLPSEQLIVYVRAPARGP